MIDHVGRTRHRDPARLPDEPGHDRARRRAGPLGGLRARGRAILLLPTWSIVHSRHWKAQIHYLARHFRVVTFDGRGNGLSDRPAEIAAYADARVRRRRGRRARRRRRRRGDAWRACRWAALRALLLASRATPSGSTGVVRDRRRGAAADAATPGRDAYEFDDAARQLRGLGQDTTATTGCSDYRGFLEFFFAQMFTEPHSTKQIEDCVAWGWTRRPRR